MSWDPSLGETFTVGVNNIVTALGNLAAILKDILTAIQAVEKKIK